MNFRALCTDIDGTLLDSRRELSHRTIAAIKRLDKRVPVILASSRMPSAMRHLQQELGILHHPIICYNGGYVIHYNNKAEAPVVLDNVSIPVSTCSAIMDLTQGTDLHISLFAEDNWYAPRVDEWTEREERITKAAAIIMEAGPVLEMWRKNNIGAHKIMCMGSEQEIEEMEQALVAQFFDQIFIYRSKSTYLELAPRTISKATALELVLKNCYNLEMSEAVAFGDNYNDIDMLKAVGLGVAVGSAREEVIAAANEITLNSKEDGVAVAVEKYFL